MGLFNKLKELEKLAIDSGDIHAIGYAMQEIGPFISEKVNSYKYTHCDLTQDENKILLQMNKLEENSILIGGDVYEIKGGSFIKTKSIDLFLILDQIQQIKNR